MKAIVKMVKGKLVGKTQLDARVFDLLLEYEMNYEEELMSSGSDEDH